MLFEDKIIGYDYVKELFTRTFMMYENQNALEQMGASLPQSVLLYGDEHHGKTYMANLFVDEAERRGFKALRIEMTDEVDKEDLDAITASFKEESICLFLDNYGNMGEGSVLPDWYVKILLDIQNANHNYLIIGVSDSLRYDREYDWPYAGIFDMKLCIDDLSFLDTKAILASYLENKKYVNIDQNDISAMLQYCGSYRMMLRVLNNAFINATSNSKPLSSDFIVEAFNYYQYLYDNKDGVFRTEEDNIETAIHEAGHAVVETVLGEDVGYVSMLRRGHAANGADGVTYKFNEVDNKLNQLMIILAGMAAVDLKLHKFASGTLSDLSKARKIARNLIIFEAYYGFELLDMDIDSDTIMLSDSQRQAVVRLLEDKYQEAKDILLKNEKMLDYISQELLSKGYVFRSDILKQNKTVNNGTKKSKNGGALKKDTKGGVVW